MCLIIPIEEARNALRLDGSDNDCIIIPLLEAIPSYLEITTGYTYSRKASPLAMTAAKFILQLWYNADGTDTEKLQRTIDSLLFALSASVKR